MQLLTEELVSIECNLLVGSKNRMPTLSALSPVSQAPKPPPPKVLSDSLSLKILDILHS